MLPRTVTSLLLLLCWGLLAVPVAAADGDVDGPLPHLGDRGPVADAPEGLSIWPGVQELVAPPGRRVEVRHLVANATGEPLELRVEAAAARGGRDGPVLPEVGPSPSEGDGAGRIVAPRARLALAPGDGVELVSTGELVAGPSGLHAIRLSTAGGDTVTAWVVLTARPGPAGLEVTTSEVRGDAGLAHDEDTPEGDTPEEDTPEEDAPEGDTPERDTPEGDPADGEVPPDAVAYVTLTAARHAVVDVRIRVRSWLGVLSDRTLADLVVGPDGPRVVAVGRPVGAPPGRLRVEVAAVDRSGETAGSELVTSVGLTAPIVAFVLLLVAGSLVAVGYRRGRLPSRRAGPGSAADDADDAAAAGSRGPDAPPAGPPITGSNEEPAP